MFGTHLNVVFVIPLLAGCVNEAPQSYETSVGTAAMPIDEGSAEAVGLLGFLNDPATTLQILDDEIGLDLRAATNLISHRDGFDRVYGTPDDDPFSSLAEVDSVPWVGPATLEQLLTYADDQGFVPSQHDYLGTWDGVEFTVNQADATLAFANTADLYHLDYEVGLDSRAVDSIGSARQLKTIEELANLYYVGHDALLLLKEGALKAVPGSNKDQFVLDLALELTHQYALIQVSIQDEGGVSLQEALDGLDVSRVWEVLSEDEDPLAHDLDSFVVYVHPDVVFPDSDMLWFGIYDNELGELLDIYSYPSAAN